MTATPRSTWAPVLLYHRVAPRSPAHDPYHNFVSVREFERHLSWLRRSGFNSVPLGALESIFAGDPEPPLPRLPVVITFDDGYEDNYRYAWPLLKRYGFAATVFVVTDAIGQSNSFDSEHYPANPMLTVAQMREMVQDGVTIGSHTCSHPESLTELPDVELEHEVSGSRRVLENKLDVPVNLFSYPHSRLDNRVEGAVARAGYRLACGGTGRRFSRYCVTRVPVRGGAFALAASIASRWTRWRLRGL